jgi:hypothetical protein
MNGLQNQKARFELFLAVWTDFLGSIVSSRVYQHWKTKYAPCVALLLAAQHRRCNLWTYIYGQLSRNS